MLAVIFTLDHTIHSGEFEPRSGLQQEQLSILFFIYFFIIFGEIAPDDDVEGRQKDSKTLLKFYLNVKIYIQMRDLEY